jgi:hypothetical protein
MNYFDYIYGGAVAVVLVYSLYALFRNYQEISKSKSKYKYEVADEPETTAATKRKTGTPRHTNCLALLGNGAIRMRDGGYIRGYRVNPSENLFCSDQNVEALYDDLAAMISAKLPVGSGLQSRHAVHRDSGELLDQLRINLMSNEINHENAFALKLHEIDYHGGLARQGFFKSDRRSFWIYVPVKHENDYSRNAFTQFFSMLKTKGVKAAMTEFRDGNVLKRTLDDEREAMEQAERHFREVESSAPSGFKLTRLSRSETWDAVYFGQNENALVAPIAPTDPRTDLRPVICGERIKGDNSWYLLHGSTPVTIITMFVPPESNHDKPNARAGIMRGLSNNPNLNFRHSTITEYLTVDKDKTDKKYSKAIGKIEKKEDTQQVTRGLVKVSREDKRKKTEILSVQDEMTSNDALPLQMRFYVIVYGERADTQSEMEASVKLLESRCEQIIKVIRKQMKGADASIEEPSALRAIYEKTLIGEMSLAPLDREIEEQADSLSIFLPAESSWSGTPVEPHSFFMTTSGRLIPLNLLSNTLTTSTTAVCLGETGAGKTVFVSKIIADILAHVPNARVQACDFGESLRPMVELLGGRHLRFVPNEVKTINIWDYPGLEYGIFPDQEQVDMVIEDTLILLQYDPLAADYKSKRSVLRKCVKDVYQDEIPRNKRGGRRNEPTLEHLVSKLRNRHFESTAEEKHALEVASLLEDYLDNPWLNSPTHDVYRANSPFDVFELDSLDRFPSDVRRVLAYRVGARLTNAIGQTVDGEFMPTVNIFDEMHKYEDSPDYSVILRALKKGAAQGRKMHTLTILIAHTYHNIKDLHNIVENTGIMFVGKQTDIKEVKEIRKWSDAVEKAIYSISNVEGSHSQWMVILGKGDTQQAEMLHVTLAPYSFWAFTSNPNERNARTRLMKLFPHWTMAQVIAWLAERYPHGLKLIGKSKIDQEFIDDEIAHQRHFNGFSAEDDERVVFEQPTASNALPAQAEDASQLPEVEDFRNVVYDFFGKDEMDEAEEAEEKRRNAEKLLDEKDLQIIQNDMPGVFIAGAKETEAQQTK